MTKARKDIQKLRSGGVIVESAHVYKNGAPIIRVENEKEFGQEIGMDSGIEIMEAARRQQSRKTPSGISQDCWNVSAWT